MTDLLHSWRKVHGFKNVSVYICLLMVEGLHSEIKGLICGSIKRDTTGKTLSLVNDLLSGSNILSENRAAW